MTCSVMEGAVACELLSCCKFFSDKLENMPKTADFIRQKYCFGDHRSCSRYILYYRLDHETVPDNLLPDDTEEVTKIIRCMTGRG